LNKDLEVKRQLLQIKIQDLADRIAKLEALDALATGLPLGYKAIASIRIDNDVPLSEATIKLLALTNDVPSHYSTSINRRHFGYHENIMLELIDELITSAELAGKGSRMHSPYLPGATFFIADDDIVASIIQGAEMGGRK